MPPAIAIRDGMDEPLISEDELLAGLRVALLCSQCENFVDTHVLLLENAASLAMGVGVSDCGLPPAAISAAMALHFVPRPFCPAFVPRKHGPAGLAIAVAEHGPWQEPHE
jgi:hypothetical protein